MYPEKPIFSSSAIFNSTLTDEIINIIIDTQKSFFLENFDHQ